MGVGLFSPLLEVETCGRFSVQQFGCTEVRPPSSRQRLLSAPDDAAPFLFRGGTSGPKKCVPYTLSTRVTGSTCIIASGEPKPSVRVCKTMPLFHMGGITRNLPSPVHLRGTTSQPQRSRAWLAAAAPPRDALARVSAQIHRQVRGRSAPSAAGAVPRDCPGHNTWPRQHDNEVDAGVGPLRAQ